MDAAKGMAEAWQEALLRLQARDGIPSRWSILDLEVQHGYWDVLAYEHDGMTEQAARAREAFNQSVQQLRDAYDSHPELGPDAADEMTDRAIQQAQANFAEDVRNEKGLNWHGRQRRDWRERRGRPRAYC